MIVIDHVSFRMLRLLGFWHLMDMCQRLTRILVTPTRGELYTMKQSCINPNSRSFSRPEMFLGVRRPNFHWFPGTLKQCRRLPGVCFQSTFLTCHTTLQRRPWGNAIDSESFLPREYRINGECPLQTNLSHLQRTNTCMLSATTTTGHLVDYLNQIWESNVLHVTSLSVVPLMEMEYGTFPRRFHESS